MHIAEIIRALPPNLVRLSSGRIRSAKLEPHQTLEEMRAKGMLMHLVLPEGFSAGMLRDPWEQIASVITVERGNGEVVAILKNRFGAEFP